MSRHRNDPQYRVHFRKLINRKDWVTTISGDNVEQLQIEIASFISHNVHSAPDQWKVRVYLDALAGCAVLGSDEYPFVVFTLEELP